MKKTFFFYDLETSGLNPRADRIMQFAGQRTTLELELIGEPVNILVKITEDALPSPMATLVTGITPQKTLEEGIKEADFARQVTEDFFTPDTIAVGYNTIRFDDEFMRALFWRNFYEPYEWQWKDGRSRWDILDVVRMTRAVRPEGIEWPVTEEGKATNRLELLTKANNLSHNHAHDALSDVFATIAVARMIREKQPKLFDFLLKMRDKKELKKMINPADSRPFLYVSGRYSADFNKATVVVPIASAKNGNVLVYDLRHDPEELLQSERETYYPIVKEIGLNKCPAVAPLGVLMESDGWGKIGLSKEKVEENLKKLTSKKDFIKKMRADAEKSLEFAPAIEPEAALYDGFLDEPDKIKAMAIRNASADRLADFCPDFHDERLPELLLHYKGRNFPESLSDKEMELWEKYRQERLNRQSAVFLEELKKLYEKDEFLANELKMYFESIFVQDY